ncbi:FxsA family protein [Dermabacter sp. p3-SID358]|uniref:FxsA family protein n=1 Tax=Dermabacter sp. p3-SID358 TaxID=2916114 RepID=UPI0021A29DBB|nr:FxsA family protein [Dermabacter sp. p3-SID358]MCT1866067.1 FxsA family protein [Dermabacter sp. p3-SID358]
MSKPQKTRSIPAWALPIGAIFLGILEIAILIWIGSATRWWVPLLLIALGWVVGFALLLSAGQQSITRIISLWRAATGRGERKKHLSRPAFTLISAVLFFFPGILTDIAGLILLFTPVQEKTLTSIGLGSASSSRRILFTSDRGASIESEIVIDTTKQASDPRGSSASSGPAHESDELPRIKGNDRPQRESGDGKTPPPFEGDVL